MWIKTLQGIPRLGRVEKDLVEKEEKYLHARLQLKIAASIERNDNSEVVSLEPDIYLFSWDNVPGNDSERLLRFLRDDLNIGWTENAEIHKSDDGKTIHIFKDENSAEIMIDGKKKKATLKINGGRTYDLKVKKKNSKLNIYHYKKSDILANIKGKGIYIEVTTKKELELFWKYQDIVLVIHEMAKLCNLKNVSVNINNLKEFPRKKEIERALEKAGLKLTNGDLPFHVRENNFTIEVKEGNSPNAFSLAEVKYENGKFHPFGYPRRFAWVIGKIIGDKSTQIPRNLPGFIVIEAHSSIAPQIGGDIGWGYIKDEIQNWFKRPNYCSNIFGVAFISNHRYVGTEGYIEEANFEIIENPYRNYNHGITTKDIVDSLTERWHVDSTCFERYRSLFDKFYEKVPKQRYLHWQEKTRREAERILRKVSAT